LTDQAKAELAIAEQASPHNPMLAALRRQMEPIADSAHGDYRLFPGENNSAIGTDPIAGKKGTVPLASDDTVSKDELDRLVRSLPPGTMEAFTQVVQPTLVNNCTATGCHGPQSTTNLRLFRVSSGEAANWRISQRNLLTVLQYVNREDPAASPLLTVPSAPHGTAKAAIFNERRANQFLRLSGWVAALDASDGSSRLANASGMAQPRADEALIEPGLSAPGLLSPDARKAKPLAAAKKLPSQQSAEADPADDRVLPASYQEPPAEFLQSSRAGKTAAVSSRKTLPPPESSSPLPPNQKVQRGAPLAPSTRADPFDPDVFNRRFHKATETSGGGKQPAATALPDNPPSKG
jgi:hypothetical protein